MAETKRLHVSPIHATRLNKNIFLQKFGKIFTKSLVSHFSLFLLIVNSSNQLGFENLSRSEMNS